MTKAKKIGIICAMPEESDRLCKGMNLVKLQGDNFNFDIYVNSHNNPNIFLITAQIGMHNAALAVAHLFYKYGKFDFILNVGVVGALDDNLSIGEVYFVESIQQHDALLPFDGYDYFTGKKDLSLSIFENSGLVDKTAKLLSGSQFINHQIPIEVRNNLRKMGQIIDMEASGIYTACDNFGISFYSIKAVSDYADQDAQDDFLNNLKIAMDNSVEVIVNTVNFLENDKY